jgi:hypothetical protein
MRRRRPHLFSDSTATTAVVVTREVLSYHLETLTSQKDEAKFEILALRLSERFISPNLRPQTGPTGGGDGKSDAETYPVANSIALRWYVPKSASAHERWAFAFSAKKDWRTKVAKDIASIVSTGRGYPHIYFITNQLVPSKDSAAVQDALMVKHSVPVTILDRTWILDRAYNGDALNIATEILGLGQGIEHIRKIIGPKDYERITELEHLERAIDDGSKYDGTVGALAEDCQRAALLARSVEKPRAEVEGRYLRAIRVAHRNGLTAQELVATYDLAWTSYFWYDDPIALSDLYSDVERLAIGTDDADELERLTNLLALLRTSVAAGALGEDVAQIGQRSGNLTKSLTRLIANTSRPNNALHARSLLLLSWISQRTSDDPSDPLVDIWKEYTAVLRDAEGLGTFPFGSIADCLSEIGEFISESAAFDELYETMTDALAIRRSEGEAATRNCERGYQKLSKGLPYEAIRWFGKAVGMLAKEEYETRLVEALIGCSFAYERAGLPWAARNCALAAVSRQFMTFRVRGKIDCLNPVVLQRLFWMELRLGRVPQILSAHQLEILVRSARAIDDEQREKVEKIQFYHARLIGALLLRSRPSDLARIGKLPDALERLGLHVSRSALLFVLGHEDALRAEGSITASETSESVKQFFEAWHAEASNMELQSVPDFLLDSNVALTSRVVGCDVQLECANNLTSIGLGEAILGTLEALLATSLPHRMLSYSSSMRIRVVPLSTSTPIPTLTFLEERGETVGKVEHALPLTFNTRLELESFPKWLKDAVMEILLKFVVPADPGTWAKTLLEEEDAFGRALTFSNIPVMLQNLFGGEKSFLIGDWMQPTDVEYPLKRLPAWKSDKLENDGIDKSIAFGESVRPEEFFNFEQAKHTDFRVISPIDVHKWDRAGWHGVMFMLEQGSNETAPVLALVFRSRNYAISIFEGWHSRFGSHDPKNDLRIAIVRGVSAANPSSYAVSIGSNLGNIPKESGMIFEAVSRINRMHPSCNRNLEVFLDAFKRHGHFLLVPAHFPSRQSQPEELMQYSLCKYELEVREAWEIGEHDPDIMVLDPDDPPVIPANQINAPVLMALAWKARRMAGQP